MQKTQDYFWLEGVLFMTSVQVFKQTLLSYSKRTSIFVNQNERINYTIYVNRKHFSSCLQGYKAPL